MAGNTMGQTGPVRCPAPEGAGVASRTRGVVGAKATHAPPGPL
jgi:hypothetical protein